tara:strand:- start:444 stop:893 length:450 start_codon:yes stop_codon:yes gene_type:complete
MSSADHDDVVDVFNDSINSLCSGFYSKQQIKVWLSLSTAHGAMDRALNNGKGWVSCLDSEIEAFAIRYPSNRLALLYCRGRSCRQGHAKSLLRRIELDALASKEKSLKTEASLLSYKLLLSLKWQIIRLESASINHVNFNHYLMEKKLI